MRDAKFQVGDACWLKYLRGLGAGNAEAQNDGRLQRQERVGMDVKLPNRLCARANKCVTGRVGRALVCSGCAKERTACCLTGPRRT